MKCRYCPSTNLSVNPVDKPPHKLEVRCNECGRWLKWLSYQRGRDTCCICSKWEWIPLGYKAIPFICSKECYSKAKL